MEMNICFTPNRVFERDERVSWTKTEQLEVLTVVDDVGFHA